MKPTMRITIDSYIRVKKAALRAAGLTAREVRERFEHPNPDYWKKQRMGHWVGNVPRVLTLVESTPEELLLPRGGWAILNRLLRDRGVDVEISSETVSGTGPLGYVYAEPGGWTLGPDQTAAARMAVLGKQGILLGPCSSGKTEILLKAISDVGERTLVIVHTERILRDWVKSAANRFFVPEGEIGVLYGRAKRVKKLTVGMVRTALNYVRRDPEFARQWGCVVLDEAHHSPASTFAELINSFPARWRLAATATPKRKDGKEGLFYDAFGAVLTKKRGGGLTTGPRVLFEITDADLDRFGRIVPVDVVIVPTEFSFDLHHAERMEREGFDRGSRSALSAVKAWAAATGHAGPLNTYADMLDAMTRDPARRARILEYLRPEVATGQTCLLLADRREAGLEMEAHLRREGVEVGRLMGGRDSKRQEQTAAGLGDGSLRVAVATTIADEGMNIPRLSRGYGCTPTAGNPGRLTQQVGRFKRKFPGKVDAVYFYFWDPRVRGLRGHAREVTRIIGHPHRVWFSERPGERVPLDRSNLAEIEAMYNGGKR